VQSADDRHPTDEVLERYSMNRLVGPELAEFEEHLLVCESCQDRLAQEDSIRQQVRDAGAVLLRHPAVAWWRLPKVAWAAVSVAVGLLVFAGIEWQAFRSSTPPPVVVVLQATRGTEGPSPAAARAGQPLTLILDLTDLSQYSLYKLEIVQAAGHPVFEADTTPRNNRLQATLTRGLAAGDYFVRVYTPARELLREYSLTVGG